MNGRHTIYGLLGFWLLLSIYFTSLHSTALLILFLLSFLIVFKAMTHDLWLLSVIVSEYSIVFAIVTSLLLLLICCTVNYTLFEMTIGFITLIVFLSPILRAYWIGRYLVNDLQKTFRPTQPINIVDDDKCINRPFSIKKLLHNVPKVSYRTLTYVTYNDISLTLDYYESTVKGKRPCVIVIHGGAWSRGDSKQLPELNSHLARRGYHCAAMNYRLAPQWKCPAPIEDTTAALNYLRQHADELNIDKDNFVLLGRSAGGQIALLTAYTIQQSYVKGVVNFYGPADMIWGYLVPTNPLVLDSHQALVSYVGGNYEKIPDKYIASSPIEFVSQNTVPTITFQGLTDALVFHQHGRRLAEKLTKYNVPNYLLELPWATHGFDYHLNGPGAQLSTFAIEYFLRAVTARN